MKKLNLVDNTKFAARITVTALKNAFSVSNLKKLTVLQIISALLLPMFWFIAPQKASAQFAPAALTPPPPSAPPAAFIHPVNSSSNICADLFASKEEARTNNRSNFSVFFDSDITNVSPGFRFGLTKIEPIYRDMNMKTFN